ncbi:unnamed protein product [Psylliodes chrysocephalus]|uniref:Uncharacterized protein n=1 Tax=Psylliodes chrysocephalus TaxID=3402493 RepID=A0A9P0DA78_9CUCU|nr:unnamed protein product [Psylliodes chrysocephala]
MLSDIRTAFVLAIFWSIAKSEPPSTDYGTPLGSPITNYQGSGSQYSGQNSYNNQNGYTNQPSYSGQNGYNNNNYNGGSNGDHQHDHGDGEPKAYEFGYQVKDDYTGTNYNRQESSDGNQVRGEYRVALPDGRTQIVTYWADWQSGFHADVKYEGEAQYPDQYNKGNGYQGVSNQYGAPTGGYNGYNSNTPSSSAINNLAAGHDSYNYNNNNNYDSYSNGYNSNNKPSSTYGAP